MTDGNKFGNDQITIMEFGKARGVIIEHNVVPVLIFG